jgi:hypothetical protein
VSEPSLSACIESDETAGVMLDKLIPDNDRVDCDNEEEVDIEATEFMSFDSLKSQWREDDEEEAEMKDEEEVDEWDTQKLKFRHPGFYVKLVKLAVKNGDGPRDEDWIPEDLHRRNRAKKVIENLF